MYSLFKAAVVAPGILGAATAPARPPSGGPTGEPSGGNVAKRQIVAFMDALGKGDRVAFDRITTLDFRAFENGKIVPDRGRFFDRVQLAIRAGMDAAMHQTDERSTIGDRVAAINYVNHGTYSTPAGRRVITWLEAVTLRRIGNDWRIDFIDSQVQSDTLAKDAAKR